MKLTLASIAEQLEALEETIIYKLIDRAQFKLNPVIYLPGKSGFEGEDKKSLFEVRLFYQETMDALFGRFRCPEERPFNSQLPPARRPVNPDTPSLAVKDLNSVNLTAEIKSAYLEAVTRLCLTGDDAQYGSSVEHDVYALQAISRRIHFGAFFVAECKYRDDSASYLPLIEKRDTEAILNRLTRKEVEEGILKRVKEKVMHIQANINTNIRRTVAPDLILDFYRQTVIPLTKKGEVSYLLNRDLSPSQT